MTGGDLPVEEVFKLVQALPTQYRAYPVVDKTGRLIGLVTLNDLKQALSAGKGDSQLSVIASKKLEHAHPDHMLDTVMIKLGRKGISQLPVVSRKDATKLLGIITLHDVARALAAEDEVAETVMASMTEAESE